MCTDIPKFTEEELKKMQARTNGVLWRFNIANYLYSIHWLNLGARQKQLRLSIDSNERTRIY
jgi:hypothetical protein